MRVNALEMMLVSRFANYTDKLTLMLTASAVKDATVRGQDGACVVKTYPCSLIGGCEK